VGLGATSIDTFFKLIQYSVFKVSKFFNLFETDLRKAAHPTKGVGRKFSRAERANGKKTEN